VYKVRLYLNFILKNSQTLYNPYQIVDIDKSIIKFKGRNSFKQCMLKKSTKRSNQVWALVNKHGYV